MNKQYKTHILCIVVCNTQNYIEYSKIHLFDFQLLAILSQDGVIRFIDTNTCSLKAELGDTNNVRMRIKSIDQ